MIYVFGDYELDLQLLELRHGNTVCLIEPQALNMLSYLLTHRDRVVTREELLTNVWHGKSLSDSVLSTCLGRVRKAVGDHGGAEPVIETKNRLGYRFVARVEERSSGHSSASGPYGAARLMHLAYPNAEHETPNEPYRFAACVRYLSLPGEQKLDPPYSPAQPEPGNLATVRQAARDLVPEWKDHAYTHEVYEKVDKLGDWQEGALGLAYLLALIRCARRLTLEDVKEAGDIWCTGVITDAPSLKEAHQSQFPAKLFGFVAQTHDRIFLLPEANLTSMLRKYCQDHRIEILELHNFQKHVAKAVTTGQWPTKVVVPMLAKELPLLVDVLFERPARILNTYDAREDLRGGQAGVPQLYGREQSQTAAPQWEDYDHDEIIVQWPALVARVRTGIDAVAPQESDKHTLLTLVDKAEKQWSSEEAQAYISDHKPYIPACYDLGQATGAVANEFLQTSQFGRAAEYANLAVILLLTPTFFPQIASSISNNIELLVLDGCILYAQAAARLGINVEEVLQQMKATVSPYLRRRAAWHTLIRRIVQAFHEAIPAEERDSGILDSWQDIAKKLDIYWEGPFAWQGFDPYKLTVQWPALVARVRSGMDDIAPQGRDKAKLTKLLDEADKEWHSAGAQVYTSQYKPFVPACYYLGQVAGSVAEKFLRTEQFPKAAQYANLAVILLWPPTYVPVGSLAKARTRCQQELAPLEIDECFLLYARAAIRLGLRLEEILKQAETVHRAMKSSGPETRQALRRQIVMVFNTRLQELEDTGTSEDVHHYLSENFPALEAMPPKDVAPNIGASWRHVAEKIGLSLPSPAELPPYLVGLDFSSISALYARLVPYKEEMLRVVVQQGLEGFQLMRPLREARDWETERDFLLREGTAQAESENWADAEESFIAAQTTKPGDLSITEWLAYVQAGGRHLEDAEKALSQLPEGVSLSRDWNMAWLKYIQGDIEGAEEVLVRHFRSHPRIKLLKLLVSLTLKRAQVSGKDTAFLLEHLKWMTDPPYLALGFVTACENKAVHTPSQTSAPDSVSVVLNQLSVPEATAYAALLESVLQAPVHLPSQRLHINKKRATAQLFEELNSAVQEFHERKMIEAGLLYLQDYLQNASDKYKAMDLNIQAHLHVCLAQLYEIDHQNREALQHHVEGVRCMSITSAPQFKTKQQKQFDQAWDFAREHSTAEEIKADLINLAKKADLTLPPDALPVRMGKLKIEIGEGPPNNDFLFQINELGRIRTIQRFQEEQDLFSRYLEWLNDSAAFGALVSLLRQWTQEIEQATGLTEQNQLAESAPRAAHLADQFAGMIPLLPAGDRRRTVEAILRLLVSNVTGNLWTKANQAPRILVTLLTHEIPFDRPQTSLIAQVEHQGGGEVTDVQIRLSSTDGAFRIREEDMRVGPMTRRECKTARFRISPRSNRSSSQSASSAKFSVFADSYMGHVRMPGKSTSFEATITSVRSAVPVDAVYLHGGPIPIDRPQNFQGRDELLRNLLERLSSPSFRGGFFLNGIGAVGKTTMLHFLAHSAPRTIVPVLMRLDIARPRTVGDFLRRLAITTCAAAPAQLVEVGGWLQDERTRADFLVQDPFGTFADFMERTQAAIGDQRLLFLIDEIQLLARVEASEHLFDFWRGQIDEGGYITVITGSLLLRELQKMHPVMHRLWRNIERVDVDFISEQAVRDVIQKPAAHYGIQYHEDSLERIWAFTAGYPRMVQRLGVELVRIMNDEARALVVRHDVDEAAQRLIDLEEAFFLDYWWKADRFDPLVDRHLVELLLDQVAEGQAADSDTLTRLATQPGPHPSQEEVRGHLEKLINDHVLVRPSPNTIQLQALLLEKWLRRKKSLGEFPSLFLQQAAVH